MSNAIEQHECPECGRTVSVDEEGYAVCCGSPEVGFHSKVRVVKPCGVCEDPITTGEICQDCAENSDIDAFTPTWG
jgi:hypothetical protein